MIEYQNMIKKIIDFIDMIIPKLSFFGTLYIGAIYHEPLLRITDKLIYENIPVEKGFFQDPYGLRIETTLNKNGKREVYMVYENNKLCIPITYHVISHFETNGLENVVERETTQQRMFRTIARNH